MLCGTLLAAAPSAQAQEPVAGCATRDGFFLQDASAFPLTMAVDQAGNQDGWVCVKILPNSDNAAAHFVIIDDTLSLNAK